MTVSIQPWKFVEGWQAARGRRSRSDAAYSPMECFFVFEARTRICIVQDLEVASLCTSYPLGQVQAKSQPQEPLDNMASSPTDSKSVAAGTFMEVTELVENMLLNLPLNEILLAQRVSHTWKNVIEVRSASVYDEPRLTMSRTRPPCRRPSSFVLARASSSLSSRTVASMGSSVKIRGTATGGMGRDLSPSLLTEMKRHAGHAIRRTLTNIA